MISVIIPAYNEEKLISPCLESVKNQSYKAPYEIIVVDNNSIDKTVEITKKYNVKVVGEKQQGVIFAKQKGLMSAKGDIVAILDADSIAPPNWLNQISQSLTASAVVAVAGPFKIYDGPKYHQLTGEVLQKIAYFFYCLLGHPIHVCGGNIAYRKETALSFGGYDISKHAGEDEFGILEKLLKCGKVVFNPKMVIKTSGRRANGGFWQLLYQLLIAYQLNYWCSRIFGKNITKSYQNFR